MKRYLVFAFTFAASFSSAIGFGAPLVPLLGSEWARNNPGKLPYSHCSIGDLPTLAREDGDDTGVKGGSVAVGVGVSWLSGEMTDSGHHTQYLNCVSNRTGTSFSIPVSKLKMISVLDAGFSGNLGNIHVDGEALHGKVVADLFGWYNAFSFNLVAGFGGNVRVLVNKKGVKMLVTSFGVGASVGFPYSACRLKQPVYDWFLDDIADPFLLTSGTTIASSDIANTSYLTVTPDGSLVLQCKTGSWTIRGPDGKKRLRVRGLVLPDNSVVVDFLNDGIIAQTPQGGITYQAVGQTEIFRKAPDTQGLNWVQLGMLQFVHDNKIEVPPTPEPTPMPTSTATPSDMPAIQVTEVE